MRQRRAAGRWDRGEGSSRPTWDGPPDQPTEPVTLLQTDGGHPCRPIGIQSSGATTRRSLEPGEMDNNGVNGVRHWVSGKPAMNV